MLGVDIHHPTDNTLLWDSVRVLTRLVRKLDAVLPAGVGLFTNRTRPPGVACKRFSG
jgi:IS5 family transposase